MAASPRRTSIAAMLLLIKLLLAFVDLSAQQQGRWYINQSFCGVHSNKKKHLKPISLILFNSNNYTALTQSLLKNDCLQ